MNYSHEYHAGNHSELFKHGVLAALVLSLCKRPKPFVVLDTHAGFGIYDLGSEKAVRTGEAEHGIGKVFHASGLVAAAPYMNVVHALNPDGLRRYPGSSLIARRLLRATDRLVACELNEEPFLSLRTLFRDDRQVGVHRRDGYEATLAFVPPVERRGVVFLDPPYEDKAEDVRLVQTVIAALAKWPTGIYAAWYPIKSKSARRSIVDGLRAGAAKRLVVGEFVPYPDQDERLAGSGIAICNTPWEFEETIKVLCSEFMTALGANGQSKVESFS